MNGTLFFSANDGTNGVELWKSDGTAAGTVMVKNILPGGDHGSPAMLTNFNGTLYFTAYAPNYSGRQLWKSDGTEAGTVLVTDLSSGGLTEIYQLTNVNNTLLYFIASNGTGTVNELWKSDGTTNGTLKVKDTNAGVNYLTDVNGTLYFRNDDGTNGVELWQSDGTETGTVMTENINPSGDSNPEVLTEVNGVLYFAANDGQSGRELWRLDYAPSVSTIHDESAVPDEAIEIAFTVTDFEINSDDLVITATSSNLAILPDANITMAGSGPMRTITLTPSAGMEGVTLVSLTVSDGVQTTPVFFRAAWWVPIRVSPDPENPNFGTIQGAVSAAYADAKDGRIILLQDGVYTGPGNKNINLNNPSYYLTIKSESGPDHTIIDLGYDGRAFSITNGIFRRSTLEGLTISNGTEAYGAALYIGSASPRVVNCRFMQNVAYDRTQLGDEFYTGGSGGAIYVFNSSAVFKNCSFLQNSAAYGGAFFISPVFPLKTEIINSSFTQNYADFGGAVYLYNQQQTIGSAIVEGSIFRENRAVKGGAIDTKGSIAYTVTELRISNSIFLENSSDEGGALRGRGMTVVNSTFLANSARFSGGGAYLELWNDFVNSIFWENRAGTTGNQIDNRGELTIGYSDIEGDILSIYNGPGGQVFDLGGNINSDPGFAFEDDLHPMPDSPCIDSGTSSPSAGLPLTDKDGTIRSLGERADIGAYEFDPARVSAAISPDRMVFTAREDSLVPEGQTLFIKNRGLLPLAWDISENIPWLRVEIPASASPDGVYEVRLYADHTDPDILAHGTYTGVVQVTDDTGADILGAVEVTLNVTAEFQVPADYPTIQQAIDEAIDGDVVIVADGTYTRDDGDDIHKDKNLDFRGKEIILTSEYGPEFTIIDCQSDGRGIDFFRYQRSGTVVDGFTFKNCTAATGGAIMVRGAASPLISNSIFNGNISEKNGGAIYISGAGTRVENSQFLNNKGSSWGGAIYNSASFVTVNSCLFKNNELENPISSQALGGAIYVSNKTISVSINDSIFVGNTAIWYGGAVANGGDDTVIHACKFYNNTAIWGGAVYNYVGLSANLSNSLFSGNSATNGGAIASFAPTRITHCTLVGNNAGQGGGINNQNNALIVENSILWNNGTAIYSNGGSVTATYSDIEGVSVYPGIGNINIEPLFVDADGPDDIPGTEDDDFRLDSLSPAIDRGRKIPGLFSDIRGSMRPIDILNMPRDETTNEPITQYSAFDMGAYEYSGDYGGLEGDLTSKAFKEVKTGGSLVVTNFDYEIQWQDKDPFPYDTRIKDPGRYTVNILLVGDDGRRIDLGTYTVDVSQHGYTIPFVFSAEHIGTWRIRVELVTDPNQYAESGPIDIQYKPATRYALGQRIMPPPGADPDVKPDIAEEGSCFWSVQTKRLYAISPITTVITWYGDEQKTMPYPEVAYITYPDKNSYPNDPDTIFHVADSMAVDLLPSGTRFDLAEIKWTGGDATMTGNLMQASKEGWSVILYRDEQDPIADTQEKFDVIHTLVWNHADDPEDDLDTPFPIEETAEIGAALSDVDHDAQNCDSGFVFFEQAYYDGTGENSAYDRAARTGPIYPVNRDITGPIVDDQTDPLDDLVVVWYQKSPNSGVCWPSKPVRYDTQWPAAAQKIVIASGLGSGPLDPATYGFLEDMVIYNQPDRSLAGYNPLEEHAGFFTAPGSEYPGVFPLRTDLNNYNGTETSDPYVLLKYVDPAEENTNSRFIMS